MNRKTIRSSPAAVTLLLFSTVTALWYAPKAHAALGDDAAAVAADQARLKASIRTTAMKGYTVHQLDSELGTTIKEYIGTGGKIFAVSWSGGRRPDLRAIMGDSRYEQYLASRRGQPRARGPISITLPGMVVTMGSYLRTSWGHVYLTDLAPAGWQTENLGATP